MPSAARLALALTALALLVPAIAGCGAASSVTTSSTAAQLADQAKANAGPAERAYMDQHRSALEAATGIALPVEHDEPGDEEVEYGEDGQPVGEEEGEVEQEFDESGEPVEARS
jgi:hypothetical protein